MSRGRKEAMIVIVDASASMAEPYPLDDAGAGEAATDAAPPPSKLDMAKEAAILLVADRAIDEQGKKAKCEVALLAFGTDRTQHELEGLGDDYAHMVELCQLQEINAGHLARLLALPQTRHVQGDILSALILAVHILNERTKLHKTDRSIVLLTDACSPLANADGLEAVVAQIEKLGVRVKIVGFDFQRADGAVAAIDEEDEDDEEGAPPDEDLSERDLIRRENEKMLRSIARCAAAATAGSGGGGVVGGEVVEARRLLAYSGQNLRKRASSANSNFAFHLTSRIDIKAQSSAITMVAPAPRLKKYFAQDPTKAPLTMERRYVDEEEGPNSEEVLPERRTRGFRYGGEIVPVDDGAMASLQWDNDDKVEMRVLATLPADRVPRFHGMRNSLAIKPHKDSPASFVAITSLGRALLQNDKVAIVRYNRTKRADPEIGVLCPPRVILSPDTGVIRKIRDASEMPHYLVYNRLPFEEDLRDYPFRPLDERNTRHFPTPEEQDAALAFVDALTLPTHPEHGTALWLAPHPGFRALWRAVLRKALAVGLEEQAEEAAAAEAHVAREDMGEDMGQEGEEEEGEQTTPPPVPAAVLAALAAKGPPEFVSFREEAGELPPEMTRDRALWDKAKPAISGFVGAFPLEKVEARARKEVPTWGNTSSGAAAEGGERPAGEAAAAGAAAGGGWNIGAKRPAAPLVDEDEEEEEEAAAGAEQAGAAAGAGQSPGAKRARHEGEGQEGGAGGGAAAAAAQMEIPQGDEMAAAAATGGGDATYSTGEPVPAHLDTGRLKESLALMLGAGGERKESALRQLRELLAKAVERAEDGQTSYYKRAVEYLESFRAAAQLANRPASEFNDFLRVQVKRGLCKGCGEAGGELWRRLRSHKLTLIEVDEREARAFLEEEERAEAAPKPAAPVAKVEEEDEDELDIE